MTVDIGELLDNHAVVITAGAGGVGKTTLAAALGVAASRRRERVLVVTVDPARRLATALGLDELGREPARLDPARLDDPDAGELWVAMLDTKASWDALVSTHAPDAETRDAILANPLYRNITGRFVQSHDYIALEEVYEHYSSGRWDLIVVDTPPSRHALDLLDAPERMVDFFSGRLIRWLTVPAGSRLVYRASRPFQLVADRILGGPFVQDIAEFFVLLRRMEEGFVARADDVRRVIGGRMSTFAVVTTGEPGPVREARALATELERRGLGLGAVIANRLLPIDLRQPTARAALGALAAVDESGVDGLLPGEDAAAVSRVVREIASTAASLTPLLDAQEAALATLPSVPVRVPALTGDIADLGTVRRIADALTG